MNTGEQSPVSTHHESTQENTEDDRLSEGDSQSLNGTSAQHNQGIYSPKNEAQSTAFFLLVVFLAFSTRLYKIMEPPHVW